jgi:Ala-tRNA(Pro) deacylase
MQGTVLHRHAASPSILRWLEDADVWYEVHPHPPAVTAAAAAHADGVSPRVFVKVVLVEVDDGRRALLALEAADRIDPLAAARALDAAWIHLLPEAELERLAPLDEVGALAPIGVLYGLPLIADVRLREGPVIEFAAGSHEVALLVDRAGWEAAASVRYAPIATAEPIPA